MIQYILKLTDRSVSDIFDVMNHVKRSRENPHAEAENKTLVKILTAAEQEFAERGFDGAGMKTLAARADVTQSLLHYHFGSKDKLYAAVIENRSRQINSERLTLLNACDLSAPDALDQVFRALFVPAFGPSGGGRAYARIVAGLIVGSERDQALVRDNYDATAKEFIRVLRRCIPHVSIIEATQIYISALGVMATSLAPDGRAARLAESDVTQEDSIVIKHLIRFAVGGARAFQNG